jgi:hypothetical protein
MTINRRGLFGFFAAAPAMLAAAAEPTYFESLPSRPLVGLPKARILISYDSAYPSEFAERFEPNGTLRRAAERYKANRQARDIRIAR